MDFNALFMFIIIFLLIGSIIVLILLFKSAIRQSLLTKSSNNSRRSNLTYRNHPQEPYSKIEGIPSDYVVFDFETTGLDNYVDEIIEIGAIKYIDDKEAQRFHSYIKPRNKITQNITLINGISNETVRKAPHIEELLPDFLTFIKGFTLIAYNSDFDMAFLQYNIKRINGKTIDNEVIDALPLASNYLPNLSNKKLETVKRYFNLNFGSHNAIDDSLVTNHLYQYCKQFEKPKYKYIIPFSYEPSELNEKEALYLEEIVKICEANGISRKIMSMYKNSSYLIIEAKNYEIVKVKLFAKLQYILLHIPYVTFESENKSKIKFTPANKSEDEYTRIFPDTPQQLWDVKEYIPAQGIKYLISRQ